MKPHNPIFKDIDKDMPRLSEWSYLELQSSYDGEEIQFRVFKEKRPPGKMLDHALITLNSDGTWSWKGIWTESKGEKNDR